MLTAAQRNRAAAAEAALMETLRGLTVDQSCEVIANAVTAVFTPADSERIGNAVNRRAWELARHQPKDYA